MTSGKCQYHNDALMRRASCCNGTQFTTFLQQPRQDSQRSVRRHTLLQSNCRCTPGGVATTLLPEITTDASSLIYYLIVKRRRGHSTASKPEHRMGDNNSNCNQYKSPTDFVSVSPNDATDLSPFRTCVDAVFLSATE